MNDILKKILGIAKDVAVAEADAQVPGVAKIVDGASSLIDKDPNNNTQAIVHLEQGIVEAFDHLKGNHNVDEALMTEAIVEVQDAFAKAKKAANL